jgi:hypothetical protein
MPDRDAPATPDAPAASPAPDASASAEPSAPGAVAAPAPDPLRDRLAEQGRILKAERERREQAEGHIAALNARLQNLEQHISTTAQQEAAERRALEDRQIAAMQDPADRAEALARRNARDLQSLQQYVVQSQQQQPAAAAPTQESEAQAVLRNKLDLLARANAYYAEQGMTVPLSLRDFDEDAQASPQTMTAAIQAKAAQRLAALGIGDEDMAKQAKPGAPPAQADLDKLVAQQVQEKVEATLKDLGLATAKTPRPTGSAGPVTSDDVRQTVEKGQVHKYGTGATLQKLREQREAAVRQLP